MAGAFPFRARAGNGNLEGWMPVSWTHLFSANHITGSNVKIFTHFLTGIGDFVISVTLGAQNDQQVTFNYLLAQGVSSPRCFAVLFIKSVLRLAGADLRPVVLAAGRVSLARAERKIKRLENKLSPAADVAVHTADSSVVKE